MHIGEISIIEHYLYNYTEQEIFNSPCMTNYIYSSLCIHVHVHVHECMMGCIYIKHALACFVTNWVNPSLDPRPSFSFCFYNG